MPHWQRIISSWHRTSAAPGPRWGHRAFCLERFVGGGEPVGFRWARTREQALASVSGLARSLGVGRGDEWASPPKRPFLLSSVRPFRILPPPDAYPCARVPTRQAQRPDERIRTGGPTSSVSHSNSCLLRMQACGRFYPDLDGSPRPVASPASRMRLPAHFKDPISDLWPRTPFSTLS